MPDVTLPFVHGPDAVSGRRRPRSVETDVTKPIEYAVNTVSGVKPHPLQFARRLEPGVRRVPHVDRHDAGRCRTCATRSRRCGRASRATSRIRSSCAPTTENQQPVVSLAVMSPTTEPARAHVAHRPDDRQGAGERAGRGAHRRQRPRHAADPRPDQAERADRAGHRRRPGDQRDPRGEPGRARRPHHARAERLDRARRRQDQGPGAVRPHHRRAAGRRRRCTCRRSPTSSTARRSRTRSRASTAARRSRSTSRRRRTPTSSRPATASPTAVAALKKRLPADVELTHRQLRGGPGREERQPRQEHDPRRRAADGADRVPVPAQLAQHDHHRAHAADRGDRDVHRALRVRLHAQLPDADGAVAVHRPPDRRRHRRAREHRAPPGAWARTT